MTATLRDSILRAGAVAERWLCDIDLEVSLDALVSKSWIDAPLERLRGRSVLIATGEQFATACALITCDGIARRMVICPPGLSAGHLHMIAELAQTDTLLCDDLTLGKPPAAIEAFAIRRSSMAVGQSARAPQLAVGAGGEDGPATEWVMLTSGTSGAPKMVIHTLRTLMGAMTGSSLGLNSVWSTFYDIRRYGGLQIFLRAMAGGGTMILSSASESTPAFLARAGRCGVTHMSGTPSHWRRALMSRPDHQFAPRYIRLSGEIADQSILDRLRTAFRDARISHAFASTEAGVAFDVVDGLAGFPATLVGDEGEVAMRVQDGSLRIRSGRTAVGYLDDAPGPIADPDGFVDTGDMVELRHDRYVFIGRRTGVINVGGLKVHPEEVEAVISDHPRVRMCVVKARKNPITGAIVTAEVVTDCKKADPQSAEALEDEIVSLCRQRLARHKVPISIRLVSELDLAVSGKMSR